MPRRLILKKPTCPANSRGERKPPRKMGNTRVLLVAVIPPGKSPDRAKYKTETKRGGGDKSFVNLWEKLTDASTKERRAIIQSCRP